MRCTLQRHCRTGDEHAIADLICDLGRLAEERGFDFLSEVKRGIGHWYAEHHAGEGESLGPDAAVEITINPRWRRLNGRRLASKARAALSRNA
jgi:hypothetical protein